MYPRVAFLLFLSLSLSPRYLDFLYVFLSFLYRRLILNPNRHLMTSCFNCLVSLKLLPPLPVHPSVSFVLSFFLYLPGCTHRCPLSFPTLCISLPSSTPFLTLTSTTCYLYFFSPSCPLDFWTAILSRTHTHTRTHSHTLRVSHTHYVLPLFR